MHIPGLLGAALSGPLTAAARQVLETCMKSCGKRFHDEVGKFRFLNELIKVVSPKVGAQPESHMLRQMWAAERRRPHRPPLGTPQPCWNSPPV